MQPCPYEALRHLGPARFLNSPNITLLATSWGNAPSSGPCSVAASCDHRSISSFEASSVAPVGCRIEALLEGKRAISNPHAPIQRQD